MSTASKIKAAREKADRVREKNQKLYDNAMLAYAWWQKVNKAGGHVIALVSSDRMRIGKGQSGLLEYFTMFPNIILGEDLPIALSILNIPSVLIRSTSNVLAKIFHRKIMYTEVDVTLKVHFYKWQIMEHLGGADVSETPEKMSRKLNIPLDGVIAVMEELEKDHLNSESVPKSVRENLDKFHTQKPEADKKIIS